MSVFVLDKSGTPLMPCSEKRARLLLTRRRARVHRLVPFVIRLVDRKRVASVLQPVEINLDPGSKTTGVSVNRVEEKVERSTGEIRKSATVIALLEIVHRGRQIRAALSARRHKRRRRRTQNLRYRAPRFDNRRRREGWLPPSLQHRVDTVHAWVKRLQKWLSVASMQMELVRFDMQAMQNPEISGVEYQQGELAGYELREYLLEKWNRQCAYCDAKNVPLQIEHMHPKATGGSNCASNLTLACACCNQEKGALSVEVFVKDTNRLARMLKNAKNPLKDAAAVNATRWALLHALKATGLPVSTGSGGLTKYNRCRLGIPKSHALDAACVGHVARLHDWQQTTLVVKCTGRGSYQRTRLNKHGFPRGYLMRKKAVFGFQTGDVVKAIVPSGKKAGDHVGRVAVRETGSFNIQKSGGVVQGVSHRYCTLVQRADGYGYSFVASQEVSVSMNSKPWIASQSALSLPGMNAEVSRAN